jgi:hypothetical protein
MRENIEWLIGQYKDEIEKLQQSRREDCLNVGATNAYLTAKIGVYGKVVNDLQTLLEESEEEE